MAGTEKPRCSAAWLRFVWWSAVANLTTRACCVMGVVRRSQQRGREGVGGVWLAHAWPHARQQA